MQKLEIVSMVKIEGKWLNQDDMSPEHFKEILETKLNETMRNIGFERIKTA